jgi:hypothetical protein
MHNLRMKYVDSKKPVMLLQEYQSMMIPITASVGIAGAFICGTVVLASAVGGAVTVAGGIGSGAAVTGSGGLLITGFATLARS